MQLIKREFMSLEKNFAFLNDYLYKANYMAYELGILVVIIKGRFNKYKVINIQKPDRNGTKIYFDKLRERDVHKYDKEITKKINLFDDKYNMNVLSLFLMMKSNTKLEFKYKTKTQFFTRK